MHKKLPQEDKRKQAYLQIKKGEQKPQVVSILNQKFPQMRDLPEKLKITIFEPKSVFGYDDILYKDAKHSTKVTCTSEKGTLFLMRKEQFFKLRKSQSAWQEVQNMVAYRTFRQNADDIKDGVSEDNLD